VTVFNAFGQIGSDFWGSDVAGSGATIQFVEPLVLKGYSKRDREGRLKIEAFFKDNKKARGTWAFSAFLRCRRSSMWTTSAAKPYRSKKFGTAEVWVCGDFLEVNTLKNRTVNFSTQLKSVAQSRNIKWMQRCF